MTPAEIIEVWNKFAQSGTAHEDVIIRFGKELLSRAGVTGELKRCDRCGHPQAIHNVGAFGHCAAECCRCTGERAK